MPFFNRAIGSPRFLVTPPNAGQTLVSGTIQKVTWATVVTDSNSFWDATNNRFTPGVEGWYNIFGSLSFSGSGGATPLGTCAIRKNGATMFSSIQNLTLTNVSANISGLVLFNGSTDFVELWINNTNTTPGNVATGTAQNFFGGFYVGP